MKEYERKEVEMLPAKYRPLSPWAYWGYSILFAIPLVGFICLIIFACSSENIARRNFARSFFINLLIAVIIAVIVVVIVVVAGVSIMPKG